MNNGSSVGRVQGQTQGAILEPRALFCAHPAACYQDFRV
eukprot:CAMPEP_0182586102 /NCGR_PEP_ID=MMETSP1324-20130603/61836_1 /TAXON_ID=236786 /ORGANISM="Florenciella sp., Strain RCC1587" /LENGTH=38 /DNA_ID= /DNA_START= /DNA_END= /DNA_ORIENTATION=